MHAYVHLSNVSIRPRKFNLRKEKETNISNKKFLVGDGK